MQQPDSSNEPENREFDLKSESIDGEHQIDQIEEINEELEESKNNYILSE